MTRLKNRYSESPKWEFDPDEAARAVKFFPLCLNHVKGMSGKFELQPWQEDIVSTLFGWKSKQTGLRRFTRCYCEVPRKNGKTTLAAGIMLYMLLVDREPGAEVYAAATTREQAGLIYEIAADMVSASPALSKRCKRLDSRKRLVTDNGYFQACSSQAGPIHGTNPHCVIFDELHEQKDGKLWEAFQTGFGARSQPLFFSITTAGFDRSSICWRQHQYAKAVEENPELDEQFLPALFHADEEDDWTAESTWEKANPCLDVSLKREFLRSECARAQEIPGTENSFRRLHLNQWTEQDTRIIPMHAWDECETEMTIDDFEGEECFAGLDLASTRDVTALVLSFPTDGGGAAVFPYFWIPEYNIDQRSGQDQRLVRQFADMGHIRTTPGNVIDDQWLVNDIYEIMDRFSVRYLGFDGWRADTPIQLLHKEGIPLEVMRKMPQTFSTYNEPFQKLLSWLIDGSFKHDGNKVLRWMASNVAHKEDPSGNIRPDKGRSAEKIDGISAMLMAMGLQLHYGSDEGAYTSGNSGVILI